MGILLQLLMPMYTGATILLWDLASEGNPVPIPNPENTMQTLVAYGCTSAVVVPSFLAVWAQNEETVEYLRQMDYVVSSLLLPSPINAH